VTTFKFRETRELKMGNPEPNPILRKPTTSNKGLENEKKRIGAETQWKLF
jgi:hypothetical protein